MSLIAARISCPGAKPASGSPQRGIRLNSEPSATNTSAAANTSKSAGTAQRNPGGASLRSGRRLTWPCPLHILRMGERRTYPASPEEDIARGEGSQCLAD